MNYTQADESTDLLEGNISIHYSSEQPPSSGHHERQGSYVPDFVFASIDNMTDAYEHVHDQVEEIAHDWTTFETLDEDELVAQAEEAGTYQLDPLNDDQDVADEMLDNFIHPPDPMDPFTSQHKLGVLPLAVIVFYNVSGGPFGVETSVRAGGNFYALLGFLVMPFVWSLQEALMTAELGTAFPEASGGVAWVEEAFGPSAGWMSGYLGWIAGATDNAIYPVLFLDYLLQSTHTDIDQISPIIRFCFLSITSVLLGYVNWRGLPLVGKMSVWICLLAMSPFIILILVGSSQVDTNRWFEFPNNSDFDTAEEATDDDASGGFFPNAVLGGVLWRPFLNNLFWNLNSFDAAGSFAGEIENSSQLFPRAMFLSVVLVASCYFFPLLIAIGATDAERQDWTDGFLAHVAGEVGGPWLGAWTVFAAAISNIALFQAELSADAFQLMGMADRGHLPKIFSKRSKHGTPTNGIILGIAVIVVMGVSNFEQLIEMLNFNYALSLLMEYCAFLKLRISRPELERPYRIPLNTVGCMLLFIPGILVTLLLLSLATYATFIFVICINIVGMLVFCAKQHSKEMAQKETSSYEKIIDASVETSVDTDETSGLDGNRS